MLASAKVSRVSVSPDVHVHLRFGTLPPDVFARHTAQGSEDAVATCGRANVSATVKPVLSTATMEVVVLEAAVLEATALEMAVVAAAVVAAAVVAAVVAVEASPRILL